MPDPQTGLSRVQVYVDVREYPDGRDASGSLYITPMQTVTSADGKRLSWPMRFPVPLQQGVATTELLAGGGVLTDPDLAMLYYQVEWRIAGAAKDFRNKTTWIGLSQAEVGQPFNLATADEYFPGDPMNKYFLSRGGTVTGDTHFTQDVDIDGTTTVDDLVIEGTFTHPGPLTGPVAASTLSATGNLEIDGNAHVDGDVTLDQDVAILGDLDVTGTINAGNITGTFSTDNVDINGTLNVDGGTTVDDLTVAGSFTLSGAYAGDFRAASFSNTFGGTFVPSRVFSVTKGAINRNGTKAGGGTNDAAIISAVMAECGAAGGGKVLLPAGGYKVTSGMLNQYPNVTLVGEGEGATILWHNIPSSSYTFVVKHGGTGSSPVLGTPLTTLAANAAYDQSSYANSTAVTVTSAAGIAVNDLIIIGDNYDEDLDANGWINRYRAEYARVKSITGNVLTLWSQLRDDYTTARSAGVWKPGQIAGCGVEDMSIMAADGFQGTTLTGGVQFAFTEHSHLSNVELAGFDNSGISLAYTNETEIHHPYIHDLTNLSWQGSTSNALRLGYCIAIGASEGTYISGGLYKNGRHGVTTGGANNLMGWARGITIDGGRFVNFDAAAIDSHPATTDMVMSSCTVDRSKDIGISIRSGRTTVTGCTVNRSGQSGISIDRKAAIDTHIINTVVNQAGNYGIQLVGNTTPVNGLVDGYPIRPSIQGCTIRESYNSAVRTIGPVLGLELINNNFRFCGRSAPTTTYAVSFNVGTDDATGLIGARFINNHASGVNACIGATGGSNTTSLYVNNGLSAGVGTSPQAIKSGQITGGTGNQFSGNYEIATGALGTVTYPNVTTTGALRHSGTTAGFYGTTPITKQAVTGSRGANDALTSLLTKLAALGIITDSSTS